MDAPINRFARGLLSFLDIKQMGTTPRQLGGIVQPVIDLTEFYLADAMQDAQLFTAAGAILVGTGGGVNFPYTVSSPDASIANGVGVRVPQDELWYIHSWHNHVIGTAVGDTVTTALICSSQAFGTGVQRELPAFRSNPTSGLNINACELAQPFFAYPGNELHFRVLSALVTVATQGVGSIRFARLRI